MVFALVLAALTETARLALAVPTPPRLPAEVDDAFALRANPAGLGFVDGGELHLLYGRELPGATALNPSPDATNGLGFFGAARLARSLAIGGAFELDVVPSGRAAERTSLGLALGGSRSALGLGYEHVNPADGRTANLLTVGYTLRPLDWLAAGVQVRDLGQTAGRRTYDVGLAVRPGTRRLVASGRWRVVQGDPIFGEPVDLSGLLSVEPLDGIVLGGGVNYVKSAVGSDVGGFGMIAIAVDEVGVESSLQDTTRTTALTAGVTYRTVPRPSILAPKRVAVVELAGDLVREPSFNLFSQGFEVSAYGEALLALQALARSDRDEGVFIKIAPLAVGWAKVQELRAAIATIRAQNRRVDCELTGANDIEYFLASACSSIMIPPAMTLQLNGVASNVVFVGEALGKLGVKVQYVARGKYKSAPEQFTRTEMSPAEQEALGAYLDRLYASLVGGISGGRKVTRDDVEAVLAKGAVTSSEALALKLIDAVVYPDEIEAAIARLYGHPVNFASVERIIGATTPRWSASRRVAVVHVDAMITGGESRNLPFGLGESAGAQTIVSALEACRADSRIAAVVLRVDSPGGDSVASDLIARSVEQLARVKPVIASFGDVAASGGYYVAAPARAIYAEPTTLTGSIGVFSLKASVAELSAKLGVHDDPIVRGPLANSDSIFSELTLQEISVLERVIDDAYARFLAVVAKGRHRSVDEIRAVAEGRIWSGEDARARGLVDELGGLAEAIARAKADVGLQDEDGVEIVTLPRNRRGLPEAIRAGVGAMVGDPPSSTPLEDAFPHVLRRAAMLIFGIELGKQESRPLALLPYLVHID